MAVPSNETLAGALAGTFLGIFALVAVLFGMRWLRVRKARTNLLPTHISEKRNSNSTVTVATSLSSRPQSLSKSIYTVKEPQSPSSLPEIRITFAEEIDDAGKRQSGRCVVVRISEQGKEGFEPYDEQLPVYQRDANDRFQSLDLERIGGLYEKPRVDKPTAAA